MVTYSQSFFNKQYVADADGGFPMATADLWLRDVNIQIAENDALTGDRSKQSFIMLEGSVADFKFLNLADFFIANKDAGSNVTVNINGVVMTPKQISEMFGG